MTAASWLWVALVLSSTAAIVLAVVMAVQVLRGADDLPLRQRIAVAVLPPWAAFESLRRGRWVAAGLFMVSVVTYVTLQVVTAVADLPA